MTAALAIARREMLSFFYSPIAYVVMTLFLLVCGYLFRSDFTPGAPVGMRAIFDWMVYLLVFISPVLTMGLLSQEWDKGTIETLMTAPVEETSVVLGKFAGSFGFFVVLLLPTLLYVVLMSFYGTPEIGPLASGYFGMLLVGALFTSIGLFCSALTRSQIIAAVSAAGILFLITIVPAYAAGSSEMSNWVRVLIKQMIFQRYTDFSRGVIDLGHVAFFVAATAVFLFLTVKVLESRRWK